MLLLLFLAGPSRAADPADTNRTAGAAGPAAGSVLRDLEKKMADVKTVQTGFVQEKKLAVFSRTVTLEGRIVLENPGRFAWHVDKPVRYGMVIAEGVVRQWDEDTKKVQKIPLSANPILKVVTEQLGSWFSGRYASLAREYDVAVLGRQPAISLRFTPRPDSPAVKAIKSVTVIFREDERYVSEIGIEDAGGDTTKLRFVKTVLNEPIPAGAWEVEPRD